MNSFITVFSAFALHREAVRSLVTQKRFVPQMIESVRFREDGLDEFAYISSGDAWRTYYNDGNHGLSDIILSNEKRESILRRAIAGNAITFELSKVEDMLAGPGLVRRRQEENKSCSGRCSVQENSTVDPRMMHKDQCATGDNS